MEAKMKRVVVGAVLTVCCVTLVAETADAQRRRRQRRERTEQVAPDSEAIAPALGELRWGMTNRQVYEHFRGEVEGRYRERISKARDAVLEDRLRREMNDESQRIRRSYTRFTGQTTGWDVSFLRDEFTHGNNESMLVVRDGNSQNFYFFINDRLWKWYKAFDATVFTGQTFEQFAGALQGRFGRALERTGRLTERGEEKRWLEWQDANTRLRAIDENRFYGFYCLVFEDKSTLARLNELRTNTVAQRETSHALVEAVTSDESEASTANQDIVDRLTGNIRRRTNAPEETSMDGSMTTSMGTTATPSMEPTMANIDDDPLRGLDL
jgi:hypothetical protein